MLIEVQIPVAPKGLATSFIETEVPQDYAIALRNRFVNTAGGLEMRQGIRQLGSTVTGAPSLTSIHELVKKDGTTVRLVSGGGSLYRYDSDTTWTVVRSGIDTTNPLHSVQFDNKLIFENGVDRNFYTEDGITFKELLAQIVTGTMGAVSANSFEDTNVDDYLALGVAANDLIWNVTRGTFALVTSITTAAASAASAAAGGKITHTVMGASGTGLSSGVNNAVGDRYRIIDLVELNVVPTDADSDNVGALSEGSAGGLSVSGVSNWLGTELRAGDWVANTTRQSLVQVSAITSAHLTHTFVSGQVSGDSAVLLKSAMPISTHLHTHFGHLFHIDARDRTKIRISAPGDPQDMTHGGTLNVGEFKFAGLQPQGDVAKAMTSFQRFFVISGSKNTMLYSGTDPLDADAFIPVGLFPQGAAAENAIISIGNDAIVLTPDGAQSVSLVGDSSTLSRTNISDAIKTTLREEIQTTAENDIIVVHYPRRSWLMVKIGARIYNFNYSVYIGVGKSLRPEGGSWSIFDGKFAQQNFYRVMQNGDLLCCGAGGKVYVFDDGDYDDDGVAYSTDYESAHLKPQGKSVAIIRNEYYKPILKTGGDITYTIEAEASYDVGQSSDSITVPASSGSAVGNAVVGTAVVGGTTLFNRKQPLKVRGEAIKVRITTPGGIGPDIIARQSLYFHRHGLE